MNRILRRPGLIACCVAVLAMNGGHWLALQTLAWGRMLVTFAHEDSLRTALVKTFNGRHPCELCLEVRKGWHQEQERQDKQPWLNTERVPEPFWVPHPISAPTAPTAARVEQPFVPVLCSDFTESPPTPPPRVSSHVL